jgi:hypothetical protein
MILKGLKIILVNKYKLLNKGMYSHGIQFKWDGITYSLIPYIIYPHEGYTVWKRHGKQPIGFWTEDETIDWIPKYEKEHNKKRGGNTNGYEPIIPPVTSSRKNADYQCTELLLALLYLGLNSTDKDSIISFANDMFESNKLICEKNILDHYIDDLKYSLTKKTLSSSFVTNFVNLNKDLSNVKIVYLTGKTYKKNNKFTKIVELNNGMEQYKPNSDIYVEENNSTIIGVSCKQNSNAPLTNKIAENYTTEEERLNLKKLRETLLHNGGITLDMFKNCTKGQKREYEKKISIILRNRVCEGKPLQDYWSELTKHVIKNKDHFIDGVLSSISQSSFLPYEVYEYDGTTLVNTKDRMLDKEKCNIRVSELFCYGKCKPRNAAKIWFDFVYDGNILYNLEVRFKNIWFQKGGSPQLFVYKESEENIKKYIETKDKHVNNS